MEKFFRRHPRCAATFVLAALLLASAVWPGAAYGGDWAAAAVALQAAWLAVIVFFGRRPLQWSRRPKIAFYFGMSVFVLVSLTFPLLAAAIGRWLPAWGALGIALAVSLILVGSIWPAQMAYLRVRKAI